MTSLRLISEPVAANRNFSISKAITYLFYFTPGVRPRVLKIALWGAVSDDVCVLTSKLTIKSALNGS